jgi:uncharacterized protein with NRDE domain
VCTVVVRWFAGQPVRVLALRDELVGREFDDPGAWWPDQPSVIGGRDRTAGGSWAVTDIDSGVSALVLNRPERRLAEPGAPSRGVLPLLAVRHGEGWLAEIDTTDMASFNLVLAAPDALTVWAVDGSEVRLAALGEGTHMVTSGGAEDGKADRYLAGFRGSEHWLDLVRGQQPADDPAALVVRHAEEDRVFATVFGQLITAVPGDVRLAYSREPWGVQDWSERRISGG